MAICRSANLSVILNIYRANHIYRHVSTLIWKDIQIGWQVYRLAGGMYIGLNMMSTCRPVDLLSYEFILRPIYIYKHVIGHAGLISSRTSVKAMYGVCILLWGYAGLLPKDIEL